MFLLDVAKPSDSQLNLNCSTGVVKYIYSIFRSGNYLMVGLIDKTNLFHVERVENRRYETLGEVRWEVFIEKLSSVCDE